MDYRKLTKILFELNISIDELTVGAKNGLWQRILQEEDMIVDVDRRNMLIDLI